MNKNYFILFVLAVMLSSVSCAVKRASGPYKVVESKQKRVVPPKQPIDADVAKKEYREETFSMVNIQDARKIRTYNVVIGSFSKEQNAINLKNDQTPEYNPIIVVNDKGMFRVILASYNTYNEAKAKIREISERFFDAWVLVQKR